MSNIFAKRVQDFLKKNDLFPEVFFEEDSDDENSDNVDDFMYPDFYLLKKYSLDYDIDLDKIKNAKDEDEYKRIIKEEGMKIPKENVSFDSWLWGRFYSERDKIVDFIKSLNVDDFDINIDSYGWLDDSYLSKFINFEKVHDILSVYTVFYDKKISKSCNVDVIEHTFQHHNFMSHEKRLAMADLYCYNFSIDSFPKKTDKEYNLVVLDLCNDNVESLDKTYLIKFDEEKYTAFYNGDNVQHNISNVVNYLSSDGIAIIKLPFTYISRLDEELVDENIIDKIIFLPEEKQLFGPQLINTKNVYVIVKKEKNNEEIEFIDKENKERCSVSNELIKKHNGCANMHIYNKNNPMLKKIIKIKEDNIKQLIIINEESKIINKQIDELDFLK